MPRKAKPLSKGELIECLIDEALGTCEPEEGCETATAHTRNVLRKKFADVLDGYRAVRVTVTEDTNGR